MSGVAGERRYPAAVRSIQLKEENVFDSNIKAAGPLAAQPEIASKEVPSFVAQVREAFAAAPGSAKTLEANTVRVIPGNQTFSTITDALNAITDAKLSKQYVLQVGPGIYNEVVHCKPWVFIQGAGLDQTTVSAVAGPQQWDKGTVRGCSNSAVQEMTIVSYGQQWGDWATAVNCDGAQNFDIENCNVQAIDQTGNNGSNLVTVSNDYSSAGGGSQVNIAYSAILGDGGAQPIGVVAFSHSYVEITDSKIITRNAGTTWGASASGQSTMTLFNCLVEGTSSLKLPDGTAQITARDCQLIGPYDPGVVIVND